MCKESIEEQKKKILRLHLWELYRIDFRKQMFHKLANSDKSGRREILLNANLENLFMLRRLRDPGFFYDICHEILEDKRIIKVVKRYFSDLANIHIFNTSEEVTKIESECEETEFDYPNKDFKLPMSLPGESQTNRLNKFSEIQDASMKFLLWKLNEATENSDEEAINVLISLIEEQYRIYNCRIWNHPHINVSKVFNIESPQYIIPMVIICGIFIW